MTNQKSLGLETNTESATIPQNSHFGIAGGWVIKKKLSLIQSIIHSDKSRGGLIIKIFRFSKFLYSHVRVFVEFPTLKEPRDMCNPIAYDVLFICKQFVCLLLATIKVNPIFNRCHLRRWNDRSRDKESENCLFW